MLFIGKLFQSKTPHQELVNKWKDKSNLSFNFPFLPMGSAPSTKEPIRMAELYIKI